MTLKPDWDAIVIGAGPAGSIAAAELARGGASVLLVDRAVFPRSKVCGCCLNSAALATLEAVGLRETVVRLGAIPLNSVRIASGRHAADVPVTGVAISREALDTALCHAAAQAGATVLQGVRAGVGPCAGDHRFVWFQRDGRKEAVTARVLIAATGLAGHHDTAVTAQPSTPSRGSRIGAGIVIPRENAPTFYSPGRIYMATGREGYVGVVRLEDGKLDLGACLDVAFLRASGGPGAAAGRILESVGWPFSPHLQQMPWKGTPLLTRRPREVAAQRLFVIGDAAGYIEPFTGEGMAWAIQSAVAMVPLALRAIKGWNNALISEWASRHARLFHGRHRMCRCVSQVFRFPAATRMIVRLLAASPRLAHPFLERLNRPVLTYLKVTA